jgi:hypothetical protein
LLTPFSIFSAIQRHEEGYFAFSGGWFLLSVDTSPVCLNQGKNQKHPGVFANHTLERGAGSGAGQSASAQRALETLCRGCWYPFRVKERGAASECNK